MLTIVALRNEKRGYREATMIGMLAGVLAFLAMSGAVVIGAQILYDPERSYLHK